MIDCDTGVAPTEVLIVSVDELPDNIGFGEKLADVPEGKPEAESITLCDWPRMVFVLTVYCALPPATTVWAGPMEIAKSSNGKPVPDKGTF